MVLHWSISDCYIPGSSEVSGSIEEYQLCQSLGYCSNDEIIAWKFVSLSNSVILSQAESDSQLEHGLSI